MSDSTLLAYILIGFPFVFTLIWCSVIALVSIMGGWHKLASDYSTSDPENVNWLSWQTARLGLMDYKSSLWVAVDPKGLYLKTGPWILFRFLHPTLLIPWKDVKEVKTQNVLLFKYAAMKVNGVNLMLPHGLIDNIKEHIAPYSA